MTLISLVAVLVLEQFRPLSYRRWVARPITRLAELAEDRLNAGEWENGVMAWGLFVAVALLVVGGGYFVLDALSPLAGWVWTVAWLYLTMGFRQFSHPFTEIHLALRLGEIDRARRVLAEWREVSDEALLDSSEIARIAIEKALFDAHRHVFGVLLWFVLLPGPLGAVLYRLTALLRDAWSAPARRGSETTTERSVFGEFAVSAFGVIDWLPQRITAMAFAIGGNFEDAVYQWRRQAAQGIESDSAIVLASGAGALGVRLVIPSTPDESAMPDVPVGDYSAYATLDATAEPPAFDGAEADVDFMQSGVGLVWRALVLWLVMLFLLGLASLVG